MKEFLIANPPVAAALYSVIGLLIFLLMFFIIEKVTPGNLWKQIIEEKNVAAAIVVAASLIGISIIIAAAIVG